MHDRYLYDFLTRAAPGLVWVCDLQGYVEFNTASWPEYTGMAQDDALGFGWLAAIHPDDAKEFQAKSSSAPEPEKDLLSAIRVRRKDGVYRRHLLSLRYIGEGKLAGCAIDAHDWLNAQQRDAAHGPILEMIASGEDTSETLKAICRAGELQIEGATCSVLLVDAKKGIFTGGVAPSLPTAMLEGLAGLSIGTGVGSCGTAAFEERDVISSDIATDPLWTSWRDAILPLGYRACWSKPVIASTGEVVATFGIYFSDARGPNEEMLAEMTRLRDLAALAIEHSRMLAALRESEEHYRHTVEQSPLIPWTADCQGRILSVSTRWTEITGTPQDEALGSGWLKVLHPDDVDPTIEKWTAAAQTGLTVDLTYRIRSHSGEYRWSRARATARKGPDGQILRWYGTVEDIHEQHLANEKLRRQAYQDELTGLANRRHFVEELGTRLGNDNVGLMVLDMDDFKLVNDRFGHQTGDAVLRLFGRYLSKIAAETEFVARLGGDEFAIISGSIANEEQLYVRATQIEDMLEHRVKTNSKARSCRPSIGCAVGRSGENPDEVFKRADLALYAAKNAGKGCVRLFDPSIRSAATQRSDALELARIALREGWIEPHYQPIVSLKDQSIRSLEALLRIRHPQKGHLPPAAVSQAFEDPTLSQALGIHMLETVVADIGRLTGAGFPDLSIALNVATENVVNQGYMDRLLGILDDQRLSRKRIKLEITERVLLDELGESIHANLAQLRQAGFSISLDDFGTGYASLVHLQQLPVDEIKIDRSFVTGLGTSTNRGDIVKAMIGLGRSMDIATVAEGVETHSEALALATLGCQFAQGYLFAKPMPIGEVIDLLQQTAIAKTG